MRIRVTGVQARRWRPPLTPAVRCAVREALLYMQRRTHLQREDGKGFNQTDIFAGRPLELADCVRVEVEFGDDAPLSDDDYRYALDVLWKYRCTQLRHLTARMYPGAKPCPKEG